MIQIVLFPNCWCLKFLLWNASGNNWNRKRQDISFCSGKMIFDYFFPQSANVMQQMIIKQGYEIFLHILQTCHLQSIFCFAPCNTHWLVNSSNKSKLKASSKNSSHHQYWNHSFVMELSNLVDRKKKPGKNTLITE